MNWRFKLVAALSTLLVLILFFLNLPIRKFRLTRKFGSKVEAVIGWLWGIALVRGAFGVKINVVADGKLGKGPFMIVSNHVSMLDIPVLLVALRGMNFRFLAAEELFGIPVLGSAMRWSNHIPFDRRDKRAMAGTYKSLGERCFEHGQSVHVFPEGTRSPEGIGRMFGSSAFATAIRNDVEILPIRMWYSADMSEVEVLVGESIPTDEMTRIRSKFLSRQIREWMINTPRPG